MSLLNVNRISKHFGGVQAINRVDFSVGSGEILGLIGPNGAGKTTLFNLITGAIAVDEGTISFQETSITGLKPHEICRKGISRTYQIARPFGKMTCMENVCVALMENHPGLKGESRRESAAELLAMTGLAGKEEMQGASLNLIDKKRLELARALGTSPKLILLDEVLGGLNSMEMETALTLIKTIRDRYEITVVWIEHIMGAIMSVCDRVIVLDQGSLISQGSPEEVCRDPLVIQAYLGEQRDA
jgi:branched-chain amino acid transport system ATP-binding protein